MRKTILIQGARENNLRSVDVEIPRDKLVVVTGVSGSGKSSLAFDTLYAEGQRRLMESMSAWAKRFVQQLRKPRVDFVSGLSPVVSIDQKTISKNPRSTVGTMTDILDYLRMLYASIGTPRCPVCESEVPTMSLPRMMEHILALPEGTEVEARAPALKIYGEDYQHLLDTIRAADHVVEMGAGAGVHGGEVVESGPLRKILANPRSLTGQYLSGRKRIAVPTSPRKSSGKRLRVRGARENNLRGVDVDIPLGVLTCVTGASGSGKSSLVHEIIFKKLYALKYDSRVLSGKHDALEGHEHIDDVIDIDQSPIGRSSRSNPATYIGFYDYIRKLFAETEEARARGYGASRFSFNVKGGRCEECGGDGAITTKLSFMPDVEVTCPACKGSRYNEETLQVTYRGRDIGQVLDLSIEEGVGFFDDCPLIARKIGVLDGLGLGYLTLGCPATILSGGEAQRVKLAAELGKMKRGKHNLYILDEPTTGLHLADIQRLLDCLDRLVESGHSVLVIEHNLDVIKTADHVIDLGPEGGHEGGEVLAVGTPAETAAGERSHTGRFLKPYFAGAARATGKRERKASSASR